MMFLCDQNLGRLARWLRIMGYDTEKLSAWDETAVRQAIASGRVVLTRLRRMAGRQGCVVIHADAVRMQLREVAGVCDLFSGQSPMSRCSVCNCNLRLVDSADIKACVPDQVYITHKNFARCPGCGRIYWSGTHAIRIIEEIRSITCTGEE